MTYSFILVLFLYILCFNKFSLALPVDFLTDLCILPADDHLKSKYTVVN
jgi:hypothetical protein